MLKNLNRKYVLILAVALSIAFVFLFRYAKGQGALISLLPNLIIATSVIVAILAGYLFTRFANIRQTRLERLHRFVELQEELQPYQEAFYWLADLLQRKYKINPQYQRQYYDLRKDLKFLQDVEQKPSGTLFVRALHEAGIHHWDYADYEIRHRLMLPEELDLINECLSSLSGTLWREKHYKPVFLDLGIPLNRDFSKVVIVDTPWLKTYAEKLGEEPNCQWDTLAFWEAKINKALDITERMLGNASYIFFYTGRTLKMLYGELGIIMGFGLFLPLVILGFDIPSSITYYLSYASLVGFIISFITVVISIYGELSSRRIT